jgi:tryptophan-rich sensory protein
MPAWVMHHIRPGTRLSTPLIQLRFNWQKSVLFNTIFYTANIQASQQGATLYTIQLGLNLAWMPIFFGLERPIEATVDILVLGATAGYLTYVWSKVDEVAAWTMVPYLVWICFATYLCVSFKFFAHSSTSSTDA